MLRRLTLSRIALTALAISTLVVAIRVRLENPSVAREAYAQGSAPCGTDPSCGSQNQTPFPGDVNCDGVINELDIPVMISLVFDCNLCPTCNPLNGDSNCDGLISAADVEALAAPCTIGPSATPTSTPGPNDCCQCDGTLCQVPSNGTCPANCDVAFDSACIEAQGCVPNTPTPTLTPTLGPNDCCVCPGNTCSVPSNSACPQDCTPQFDSACTDAGACVANTPTVTPTPTLGANDCCVCPGNTCSVPSNSACPQECTPQRDSACTDVGACVANTPTPTLTPTLGPADCCECGGVVCAVPSNSACPQDCNPVFDSACIEGVGCVANTPTVTPTPTLGANDCCVCPGNTCSVPSNSACPQECTPQRDSACTDAGACVANTPTNTPTPSPTRTPTLGANDCCQCAGVVCAVPSNSACPQDCNPVFDSACVEGAGCVPNTVTPTLTPTLGPNDCCACEGNTCVVPSNSACPENCTPQFDSACTDAGACVANTPTRTPTPTQTRTPTLGANDCCACPDNSCVVPSNSACPENCTPQVDSACTEAGACVANTPTATPTPTLGANDCCVCEGNTCAVPSNSACPENCTPQFDSACSDAGACVANTPTPTRTRPPATRTKTMTPMIIPFPC